MIDLNIKQNLDDIYSRIRVAAEKSGRSAEDIKLIAVTKTVDVDRIRNVYDCGIFDFGENKVQELVQKYDTLDQSCKWHLIGHLQTNKVKYIIDKVAMIHSVDSLQLAEEINKRAAKLGKKIEVLLQVNVSGEESKFGIEPERVHEFVKSISNFNNISLKGMMTIAPHAQNIEDVRPVFKKLYKLYIDIKNEKIDNVTMDYLSMGMSNDFEVAIEEGANIIRIGTGIFGKRNYSQE